jgi:two-component system response regulator RegX3
MEKILIIEDDATIVKALRSALEHHGFQVLSAPSGAAGMPILEKESLDLVLLDIMLPGPDGFEVCRNIRRLYPGIPIIMVTAKSSESDKLLGFELGIDDYITKPFSAAELIARIRAVMRRYRKFPARKEKVAIGEAEIDLNNFMLRRGNKSIPLSPKEKAILELLILHPDTVISRDRIIDEIWGDEYFPTPKTIDNFIRKLRLKIERNPASPEFILTVHGVGYKLKPSGNPR